MTAIIALFPGLDPDDAILLAQRGGSVGLSAAYLDAWGVAGPGLWRLDWPEDEDAPPVATLLGELPAIPDLETPC